MKILFMGTPDFAVASLKRLVEDGYDVAGVFTQPDKPKNRGMKLTFSPVKEYAITQNIPAFQPLKMKDGEAMSIINEINPDLIVVAAYGKILPEEILNYPSLGCINVHSSVLPKYRGAAPINWAILDGEKETGVTIMYMAKGLDTGDIIHTLKTPISPDEDAEQLTARLAEIGAQALSETVVALKNGTAKRTPQGESGTSYASMLSREMSPIDWTNPAEKIKNQILGLIPWPCATMELHGAPVKVYRAEIDGTSSDPAGTIVGTTKKGLQIVCGDGKVLLITELQPGGKKRMSAADYLRGHPIK